ncbi:hypothetical protein KY284_004662 [Solanum tuberosum]|nr:hypothetical protein KY284_004662 [Solanum tuberosum]
MVDGTTINNPWRWLVLEVCSIISTHLKMIVRAWSADTSSMNSTITELAIEVVVGRLLLLVIAPRLLIDTPILIMILMILCTGSSITVLVIVGALTGRNRSIPLSKVGSNRNIKYLFGFLMLKEKLLVKEFFI